MNKKLKIGEFSKLCRVTVKTLRHYEEMGLLVPHETDEWTGYRYYSIEQFQQMGVILHLKQLGLSLAEIADVLQRGDNRPDLETVQQKMAACRAEINWLQLRLQELQSLEEHFTNEHQMERITIKTIPSRIVASYRKVMKSYDELGETCVKVIGPEMMRVGCTCPEPQYCYTVEHDAEHKDTDIDVEYCEAVGEWHEDTPVLRFYQAPAIEKALCFLHYGPYSTFSESMLQAVRYLEEHGLKMAGSPRFSYIDGVWNKSDESEWLTEIQIPLAD